MRRPTPLPAPPAPAVRAGRDDLESAADASHPADAGAPADAETDAAIPADRPDDSPAGSAGVPAEAVALPGSGGERPVGLRDVWRAARARRRALRAEVRRFTVRRRRRRAVWIGVTASLLMLVAATLGAAYSPLFDVETITVVGTSQLDASTVERALDSQLGTPLPLVDESAVKAALVAFPLVESYALEARPPHELVVRIVERTPVGVVDSPAGYTLVDAAGVALDTTATPPPGQPVITVEPGVRSDTFVAVGKVIRSLPGSIRVQVTAVSASTPDDVTLSLGATNTRVVWGSADDSAIKALVLETTMKARPPASVSEYDVSSPSAIVVR